MRNFKGYNTKGMTRLIMTLVDEMQMPELKKLVIETRCKIAEEWKGYEKGLTQALLVYDYICLGYYDSEIGVKLGICRERVRQIHDQLAELKCVQELKTKLKATQSAE